MLMIVGGELTINTIELSQGSRISKFYLSGCVFKTMNMLDFCKNMLWNLRKNGLIEVIQFLSAYNQFPKRRLIPTF